ncbi:uncharacterized protein MKK02DRAFT_31891 [Dioszegia hungarica]|uniref:Uncharacterized protein n=1 Tax=Dioszegia hungarica TaxID=4972 RepID=A0AA38HD64_9TREE|nr:uncharacterized protein MKK02DRAFT_31891 [Dioszegia hungarica]KAI9638455.1 hypothetical protein MKK02DRAFT_31891 [Dioszegia hungarica]
MLVSRLLAALTVSVVALIPSADGRFLMKRNPSIDNPQPAEVATPSCHTNAECIQQGLPVLAPRSKRDQQQARAEIQRREVISLTQTCGAGQFVGLPDGKYRLTIAGAQGGVGSNYGSVGGLGAVVDTNITIRTGSNGILFSYYIGCAGIREPAFEGSFGGGGGSFFWITPPGKYPQDGADVNAVLLAAGGGGGAGYFRGSGGPGGTDPYAAQTAEGGIDGGDDGRGGGGGAGYMTAGEGSDGQSGYGGSQSPYYGGTFKGGNTGYAGSPYATTGGAGGGGGASSAGGGGGGGFHGGNGGRSSDASRRAEGGTGGSSYAKQQTDPRWLITVLSAVATQAGSGSIRLERY